MIMSITILTIIMIIYSQRQPQTTWRQRSRLASPPPVTKQASITAVAKVQSLSIIMNVTTHLQTRT